MPDTQGTTQTQLTAHRSEHRLGRDDFAMENPQWI
jgi:hypothetical protein